MPTFGTSWDKVDRMYKRQFKDHWLGIIALVVAAGALVISLVKQNNLSLYCFYFFVDIRPNSSTNYTFGTYKNQGYLFNHNLDNRHHSLIGFKPEILNCAYFYSIINLISKANPRSIQLVLDIVDNNLDLIRIILDDEIQLLRLDNPKSQNLTRQSSCIKPSSFILSSKSSLLGHLLQTGTLVEGNALFL